jgi:hypothetical protein
MKTGLLFVIILLSGISCRDAALEGPEENLCGVSDPLTELDWLREEIKQVRNQTQTIMDIFVYSARYQGSTVFFTDICCPICNFSPPEVRNCQGDSLGRLGDGIPADKVVSRSLIWESQNGVCSRD